MKWFRKITFEKHKFYENYNDRFKIVKDSALITKAFELGKKNNCTICKVKGTGVFATSVRIIVWSTKRDFYRFVKEYIEYFDENIENIIF